MSHHEEKLAKCRIIPCRCGGEMVTATLTGLDYKGAVYEGVGYPQATILRAGKRITGRVFWLAGGANFEEEARYRRRTS